MSVFTALCPECVGIMSIDEVILGQFVACPDCGTGLEVVSLDPPSLELAPLEKEDWGE